MSIQRRIWESMIKNLQEGRPSSSVTSVSSDGVGGIAGTAADSSNAVSPGMKSDGGKTPGGKTPGGKITVQRWDGEKGKFKQEVQVPWDVKVIVDDIVTSVSGYTNLMPSMSKDADSQTIGIGDELFRVAAPYMAKSMLNLIDRVGKKEALEIIAGEIPNPPWQTGEMHIPGPVPGLEPPEGNEPLLRPDGRPYGTPASPGPKPGEPGGPVGPPEPDQFPPPVDPDGKPYWWYDLPFGPDVILPPFRPGMHEPFLWDPRIPRPPGIDPDAPGWPTKYPPNEWPYGPYPDGLGGWRWLWPGWSPTDPVPGGPNIVSDPYASL